MSTRGPSKQHVLATLLPSSRGSSCCSLAYDLSPGERMTHPDDAAAAGHLFLVQEWARKGRRCTARGADLAAARGYEEIVSELEEQGVPTNFKPLMELFRATKGENWRRNDGWGSDEPAGQWYGVKTNQAGQVTQLQLTANRLRGVIPSSIGQLAELRVLDLEHNALSGQIPDSIGDLKNLQVVCLDCNKLEGRIPQSLTELTSLERLHLSCNLLTGSIPKELHYLPRLQGLTADWNLLSDGTRCQQWFHPVNRQKSGQQSNSSASGTNDSSLDH